MNFCSLPQKTLQKNSYFCCPPRHSLSSFFFSTAPGSDSLATAMVCHPYQRCELCRDYKMWICPSHARLSHNGPMDCWSFPCSIFVASCVCCPPHPPGIWIDSLSCQYNNDNATHCHSSLMSSSLQLTATWNDFYLIYICHSLLFSVLCSRWDLFMNAFAVVVVVLVFCYSSSFDNLVQIEWLLLLLLFSSVRFGWKQNVVLSLLTQNCWQLVFGLVVVVAAATCYNRCMPLVPLVFRTLVVGLSYWISFFQPFISMPLYPLINRDGRQQLWAATRESPLQKKCRP